MQLRLPIDDAYPPASPVDPATLFSASTAAPTEVDRLQSELAAAIARQAKWQERRDKCNRNLRKLRDRQES